MLCIALRLKSSLQKNLRSPLQTSTSSRSSSLLCRLFHSSFTHNSFNGLDYVNNMADILQETGNAYPSRATWFTPSLCFGPCCSSFHVSLLCFYFIYLCSVSCAECCQSRLGRDVQQYMIKIASDLRQVGGFLQVLRFPLSAINKTDCQYCNIVESGVKHHKKNQFIRDFSGFSSVCIVLFYIIYNSSAYLRNIISLCIEKFVVLHQFRYHPGSSGNMTSFVFLIKIQ